MRGPVLLGAPVERIVQDGEEVMVVASERTHRARRAIVTAPVATSPAIEYEPGLPEIHAAADRELKMEPAIKLAALLPLDHKVKQHLSLGGSPVGVAWRYGRQAIGFVTQWQTDVDDETLLTDFAATMNLRAEQLEQPIIMRWNQRPYIPGRSPDSGRASFTPSGQRWPIHTGGWNSPAPSAADGPTTWKAQSRAACSRPPGSCRACVSKASPRARTPPVS